LAAGLGFFSAFSAKSQLVGTINSDGTIDIIMELVSQGNENFNSTEYWKSKQKFYGLT
jgi:hypothetical protein